jgi:hypothetical protein
MPATIDNPLGALAPRPRRRRRREPLATGAWRITVACHAGTQTVHARRPGPPCWQGRSPMQPAPRPRKRGPRDASLPNAFVASWDRAAGPPEAQARQVRWRTRPRTRRRCSGGVAAARMLDGLEHRQVVAQGLRLGAHRGEGRGVVGVAGKQPQAWGRQGRGGGVGGGFRQPRGCTGQIPCKELASAVSGLRESSQEQAPGMRRRRRHPPPEPLMVKGLRLPGWPALQPASSLTVGAPPLTMAHL